MVTRPILAALLAGWVAVGGVGDVPSSRAPQAGANQAADLVDTSARDPFNGRESPRHRSASRGAETATGGAPSSATPRSAPVQPAQSGAPLVLATDRETAINRTHRLSSGAPLTLAAVTWQGIVNYATPSHGRWYLAIPAGPGIRVRICGPAGCLERISTDAGPDLAQQRAGHIADLNWLDWQRLSGVGLKYGGFQGTVLVLSRVKLPETSTQ